MITSEKVTTIIPALLKVKAKIEAVVKSANNPFFKSKYADLNTYLAEVEPLLAENRLVLLQPVRFDSATGKNVVSTTLFHESGEFVSSEMGIDGSLDAQKMGAAVTYFRRYTLGFLLGMQSDDDDGNTASGKANPGVKVDKSSPATTVTIKAAPTPQASVIPTTETARPGFRNPRKPAPAPVKVEVETSSGDDL